MALIRCDFFSDVLQLGTSMTVLLPQASEEQIGAETTARSGPPPVLYLLHGLSDDDSAWLRYTSIDRYASALGLAVVMPQVHRSFYTDLPHEGGRYWTFSPRSCPRSSATSSRSPTGARTPSWQVSRWVGTAR